MNSRSEPPTENRLKYSKTQNLLDRYVEESGKAGAFRGQATGEITSQLQATQPLHGRAPPVLQAKVSLNSKHPSMQYAKGSSILYQRMDTKDAKLIERSGRGLGYGPDTPSYESNIDSVSNYKKDFNTLKLNNSVN